jgi:hypothetical protein
VTARERIYGPVTQRSALGRFGQALSKHDGESLMVVPLAANPGMLVKVYRPELTDQENVRRLDRLIELPDQLGDVDRKQLTRASCWPLSRVVDNGKTLGVLLPKAPARFSAQLRHLKGWSEPKPLPIDWLAQPGWKQAQRGLPSVDLAQRMKVCRDIAAVAAILERHSIVYGDWSYSNAFWSIKDFSGYLIDVDGCALRSRPWVRTVNWEDSLTPEGVQVDTYTDRYRLALLLARCLTGVRDTDEAVREVLVVTAQAGMIGIGQLLKRTLHATTRTARPSIAELHTAMVAPSRPGTTQQQSNVVGWKSVHTITTAKSASQPPQPSVARQPVNPPRPRQPVQPVSPSPAVVLIWVLVVLAVLIVLGVTFA